jgi:hypothetical protein
MKTLNKVKCVYAMILVACLLSGCAARRIVGTTSQDSVRVEVVERVEYITDTIEVAIPYEREAVTRDTLSHLANAYAISDAAILPDGRLFHSLETIPQLRPLSFKKPILRRDSIVFRNFYREEVVEVERDLTWWQETQIRAFWAMFSVFCIIILWKLFRSKLGAFFKSFL